MIGTSIFIWIGFTVIMLGLGVLEYILFKDDKPFLFPALIITFGIWLMTSGMMLSIFLN